MTTLIIAPLLGLTLAAAAQSVASARPAVSVARTESLVVTAAAPDLRGALIVKVHTTTPAAVPAPVIKPRIVVHAMRPVIPVATASPTSVIGIIDAAAARWGVSGSYMVGIARCESGLRTNAVNPSGPYLGLFQFLQSTFTHNGGTNIWDAADQANIAAKMLAHGQAYQWSCA